MVGWLIGVVVLCMLDGPVARGYSSHTHTHTNHTNAKPQPKHRRSALLLGHTASVGTCLALSPDGSLLASGDRDEKVRVSHFPCTLVVQGYLTGKFIFVYRVG